MPSVIRVADPQGKRSLLAKFVRVGAIKIARKIEGAECDFTEREKTLDDENNLPFGPVSFDK